MFRDLSKYFFIVKLCTNTFIKLQALLGCLRYGQPLLLLRNDFRSPSDVSTANKLSPFQIVSSFIQRHSFISVARASRAVFKHGRVLGQDARVGDNRRSFRRGCWWDITGRGEVLGQRNFTRRLSVRWGRWPRLRALRGRRRHVRRWLDCHR